MSSDVTTGDIVDGPCTADWQCGVSLGFGLEKFVDDTLGCFFNVIKDGDTISVGQIGKVGTCAVVILDGCWTKLKEEYTV